jgi:PAS domain S-box-containing protein
MELPRPRARRTLAPRFERREERRIAATLRAVGLTFLVVLLLLLAVSLSLFEQRPRPQGLSLLIGVLGLIALSLWLLRRGRLRPSAHVLIWTTWAATTAGMIGAGGIGTPGFSFYVVTIAAAGMLLGGNMAIAVALLSAAASAAIAALEAGGLLPAPVIRYTGVATLWWIEMTLFAATASLIYISVRRMHEALDDAERGEENLAERNLELSRTLAAKRQAEESEAVLNAAMGQAREAILVVDVDGRVRYVNAAFEALTGRRAAELTGGDARDFFGALQDRLAPDVTATLATGEAWHGRVPLGGPGGRLVDASLAAVRDDAGHTTHYVAVARDVTREAALEAELRQSQKLEALGQLAGGVAHDFNNLLAVIQGYAEILEEAPAEAEQRDALDQIGQAARQAADLTAQLLAFGRRQVSHPRVVDLNGVVREADGMLRTLVPESIEIETELEGGLPPVRIDPGQIHQVLLNLAANARDAMPSGGRLTIRTARAREGVRLDVADTGEGMDPETRERIFEPFFTTKRPGEGTGLGLASVYGIVEQCGATIEVESAPGRGARFSIAFPASSETVRIGDRLGDGAESPRQASVLVVEDEPGVRRLLGRQLAGAGFAVTLAGDGDHALTHLDGAEGALDVLVTDVTMPRMGGADLAARLRERWPEMRVLYISGYWPDDLVAKIEADPLADFLAKPFSQQELLGKLDALLAA